MVAIVQQPSGRPKKALGISSSERQELLDIIQRSKVSSRELFRVTKILMSAEGLSNIEVVARLSCTLQTVGKWRERFRIRGIKGFLDLPRPGASRKIGHELVRAVLRKTLESDYEQRSRQNTRTMAKEFGISLDSISWIWRSGGIRSSKGQ